MFRDTSESKSFELNLIVKDKNGKPTNIRRTIKTDSAAKLAEFWNRYQGRPKRHNKNKNGDKK